MLLREGAVKSENERLKEGIYRRGEEREGETRGGRWAKRRRSRDEILTRGAQGLESQSDVTFELMRNICEKLG